MTRCRCGFSIPIGFATVSGLALLSASSGCTRAPQPVREQSQGATVFTDSTLYRKFCETKDSVHLDFTKCALKDQSREPLRQPPREPLRQPPPR